MDYFSELYAAIAYIESHVTMDSINYAEYFYTLESMESASSNQKGALE